MVIVETKQMNEEGKAEEFEIRKEEEKSDKSTEQAEE